MSRNADIKSLESKARTGSNRAPDYVLQPGELAGELRLAEITDVDVTYNVYDVSLIGVDGNTGSTSFERVAIWFGSTQLSQGDKVILYFQPGTVHPVILTSTQSTSSSIGITGYIRFFS